MVKRLAIVLVSLLVILGALEGYMRANDALFAALSDKFLLREQVIERFDENTELMFLGTSRMLDAVDHETFSRAFEKKTGQKLRSFNAALAGVDIEQFVKFAMIAADREGLRYVVLEASTPALTTQPVNLDGSIAVEEAREAGPNENSFPDRIEDGLRQWMYDRFAIVRHRKALRPKSLAKVFVIGAMNVVDPNVWSRKGVVRNLIGSDDVAIPDGLGEQLLPEVWRPERVGTGNPSEDGEGIIAQMKRLSKVFREAGVEVIWLAPPISEGTLHSEYFEARNELYRVALQETESWMVNYGGHGIPGDFLRDPTHLNASGRSVFSQLLAEALAKELKLGDRD